MVGRTSKVATIRPARGFTMVELGVAAAMIGAVVLAAVGVLATVISARNTSTWVDAARTVAERHVNEVLAGDYEDLSGAVDAARSEDAARAAANEEVQVRGVPVQLDWALMASSRMVPGGWAPAWKDVAVTVQPATANVDLPPVTVTRRATAGDLVSGATDRATVTFVAAGPGLTSIGDVRDLPQVTIVDAERQPLPVEPTPASFSSDGTATVGLDLSGHECSRTSPCRVGFAQPDAHSSFVSDGWAFDAGTAIGTAGEVQVAAGQQVRQTVMFGRAATLEVRPFAQVPGGDGRLLPAESGGLADTVCADVEVPTGLDSPAVGRACAGDGVVLVDSYQAPVGDEDLPLLGGMDVDVALDGDTMNAWGVPSRFGPASDNLDAHMPVAAKAPGLGTVELPVAGGTSTWDLTWTWPNGGPAVGQPGVPDVGHPSAHDGAFVFVPLHDEPGAVALHDVAGGDQYATTSTIGEVDTDDVTVELGAPGWSPAGWTSARLSRSFAPAILVDLRDEVRGGSDLAAVRLDGGGMTVAVAARVERHDQDDTAELAAHAGGDSGWWLTTEHASGRLAFTAGTNPLEVGATVWSRPDVVGDGTWHHLTATVTDDGRVRLYVDGDDVTDDAYADVTVDGVVAADQLELGRQLAGNLAFLTVHAETLNDVRVAALADANQQSVFVGGPVWTWPREAGEWPTNAEAPCPVEGSPLCHSGAAAQTPYLGGRHFAGFNAGLKLPRWALDGNTTVTGVAFDEDTGEAPATSETVQVTRDGQTVTWDDLTTSPGAALVRVNRDGVTIRQDATSTGVRAAAVDEQGRATTGTVSADAGWIDVVDGELQIDGIPPAGTNTVPVEVGGTSRSVEVDVTPIAGTVTADTSPTVAQDTAMDPTATIPVSVTDLAGVEMDGARALAALVGSPSPVTGNCDTDVAGDCSIELQVPQDMAAGTYTVAVRSGAAPTATTNVTVEPIAARLSGSAEPVHPGHTATARLLVTDAAGNPFVDDPDDPLGLAVTGTAGLTVTGLSEVGGGAWTVEVEAATDVDVDAAALAATIGGESLPGTVPVEVIPVAQHAQFDTAEQQLFGGFTTTLSGDATPGTELQVQVSDTTPSPAVRIPDRVTVNGDGQFTVPVTVARNIVEHPVTIEVADTLGTVRDSALVTLTPPVALLDIDADLTQGADGTLKVGVSRPDGRPAAASVTLEEFTGPDGTDGPVGTATTAADADDAQVATFDLALGAVPAGTWQARLTVTVDDDSQTVDVPVQVAPTLARIGDADVTVGQGQTVTGFITAYDLAGEAMSGAWLEATSPSDQLLLGAGTGRDDDPRRDEVQVRTDRNGRARLTIQSLQPLPPGPQTVSLAGAAGTGEVAVTVVPTLSRLSVSNVRASPGGDASVTVCALDVNDALAAGVAVTVPAVPVNNDGLVAVAQPRTFTTGTNGCGTTTLQVPDGAGDVDDDGNALLWPVRADAGPVRGRGNLTIDP